ncbi:27 kDa glycoprotein-like isoform X2 [Topomyia yanbarensis]|uniref:27 kDa glycoprotein-like isoform X2 n=1 Tax=Topomyia yanbarensis TaxID=2498891 RepID=UPI00273C7B3A|nr:27 kDa glycoprotein-like isoform X2 [Topomyia yanbarensis]
MARIINLLLVVAILSGATNAKPSETRNAQSKQGELVSRITDMLHQLRASCVERSGSEEGFRQIMTSIQSIKSCAKQYVDVPKLKTDLKTMTRENNKELFENYCPQFNKSKVCFEDIIEGVATCAGQDADETRAIANDMLNNAVELMCKNDGEIFFETRKPEFHTCVAEFKRNAQDCNTLHFAKGTPMTRLGEAECRAIEETKECFRDKLSSCKSTVMGIVDVFYDPIISANNCQQVILILSWPHC